MISKEELEEHINIFLTQQEIKEIYGVSQSTVSHWFKKYDLKSKNKTGGANNVKNLEGLVFGNLTVIKQVDITQHGKRYLCKCVCGNEKIFRGSTLTSGTVIGCGCSIGKANIGKIRNEKAIPRIGEKHGKLTILDIVKNEKTKNYEMLCLCECGNKTQQIYADIKNGKVKSCGCYNKETSSIVGSTIGLNNYKSKYKWYFIQKNERVKCRSGYEVIYANYLLKNNVDFIYEPKCFKLGNGKRYTPDFYLKNEDKYIEIKGSFKTNDSNQEQNIKLFSLEHNIEILYWKDLVTICDLEYKTYEAYLNKAKRLGLSAEDYLINI